MSKKIKRGLPNDDRERHRSNKEATRDDTSALISPAVKDYISAWTETEETDVQLATVNSVFGARNAWFVRSQYVELYENISSSSNNAKHNSMEIIQGSAGIGKSSFLVYMLARLRLTGKCAMMRFHPRIEDDSVLIFFPQGGGEPVVMSSSDSGYYHNFLAWYDLVGEDHSVFLVDGNVTFTPENVRHVTYVVAKSPSGTLGVMDKGNFRNDHWITPWQEDELVSYGTQAGIEDIEDIAADNMLHIGGIVRYALRKGAARRALAYALIRTDAQALMKLMTTGIKTKGDDQKIVDRLLHYHDPFALPAGCKPFTFASEYVASRVAQVVYLENAFSTNQLLNKVQGVGEASNFRGVLFEAYAARRLSEGGSFHAKKIDDTVEDTLVIAKTEIYHKPTKVLNKTNFPPQEIRDKVVWSNPEYNLPAVDMLMFLSTLESCVGFQMTVARRHTLSHPGTKAAINFFDSACLELTRKEPPDQYRFYFAVPPDIYDGFSNQEQNFADKLGKVIRDANTCRRVEQWILKIE